jgi:thiol:disulfide interchange protein
LVLLPALLVVGMASYLGPAVTAAPPTADSLVQTAVKKAQAEKKTVLIEFGASWCVWCRNFENFVKASDTGPIVAANFVVVNLTVKEDEGKKALENPGGEQLMTTWGGAKAGLPFYVFLDAKGQKIADSNAMPGGKNIGFPAVPEEIAAFMTVIDKTAPRLSPAERGVLEASLKRTAKPAAH